MPRLHVFGCSHTTPYYNLENAEQSWTHKLATSIGFDLVNHGKAANSNDGIVYDMLNAEFANNDLIVILVTYPHRIMIDEKTNVLASTPEDEWWYRVVHHDWFYQLNLVRNILAMKQIIGTRNHLMTFADPTELFKFKEWKKVLHGSTYAFLPKITLGKSFGIGADKQHMPPEGHDAFFRFLLGKLPQHQS